MDGENSTDQNKIGQKEMMEHNEYVHTKNGGHGMYGMTSIHAIKRKSIIVWISWDRLAARSTRQILHE
eukprot:857742-Pleurochrysis_carterae.AAC.1